MEKYYLFGAGNNVWGIINYFGGDNIIAIIDNERKRVGIPIKGIPVISFENYMESHRDETVIITAAIYEGIVQQLERKKIRNYYVAPMIQFGLADTRQMILEWHLEEKSVIVLYGYNPISIKLLHDLRMCKGDRSIKVIPESKIETEKVKDVGVEIIDFDDLKKSDTLVLFSENISEKIYKKISAAREVLDIYELKIPKNKTFGQLLKKYKNIHKGERCIIIGNGPSLKIEDLNRVQESGICNFGMNLSFKVYDKVCWRPTYYTVAEYNIVKQYYDEIKELNRENMFIKNFYDMEETPHLQGVNYYPGYPKRCYLERQKFSNDISEVVYSGYTVMFDTLQIATYMGFTKIYLIGADFSYSGDATKKGNHFYDDDVEDKRIVAGITYINISLNALLIAKNYADAHGIQIYNATRGGKLEIFPRVDLDTLI